MCVRLHKWKVRTWMAQLLRHKIANVVHLAYGLCSPWLKYGSNTPILGVCALGALFLSMASWGEV